MMKIISYLILCTTLISCSKSKTTALTSIDFPDKINTSLPSLFTNNKDEVFLSWVKKIDDSTAVLKYSKLNNKKWELPKKVIQGTNWFVNWADYPAISENKGTILTHFLKKSAKNTYTYDIKLNITKDSEIWKKNIKLHHDQTKTEHGFVTMIPYKKNFFLTWLDGRNTNSTSNNHEHSGHNDAMNIRCAEVTSEGNIINKKLLDTKTCSCCQTSAAITNNGPVVVYRDRTDNEIRDIAITRYINKKWTAPQPIYNDQWMIPGCPVNGPKIDAIENTVAVAWFTAVNNKPEVKVIFSEDSGANFYQPIIINSLETLGRVDITLIDKQNAIVSWIEGTNEKNYLKAMKVNISGKKSTPIMISEINGSRKSGFPQMEKSGTNIYFAWTSIENNNTSIQTTYINIQEF